MRTFFAVTFLLAGLFVLLGDRTFAQSFEWLPGGTYDPAVPTPESVLGFPLASRPARYEEVVRYIKALADASPYVDVVEMGETYEHRIMYLLIVSSRENIAELATHKTTIGRLADPRLDPSRNAEAFIPKTPIVVWIGYGIHGDEISSVDACMQVAYQLAAGTDARTNQIRQQTIVCLEPMENPDGRERFLAQMQQWSNTIPNSDLQSISHQGVWPSGRGNHYLFDLNRDWFAQIHPESRNRMKFVTQWNPQVLIDSHEMGANDTYVFSPPRAPVNPNVSAVALKWWPRFAADHGKAFDRFGWSYYTREWVDEWYPGYGSSWPLYSDAVGILYEQAGTDGLPVKRSDGTTLTYRDAVHHHFTSSLANLTTAAENREELLRDFANARRRGIEPATNAIRAYYIDPSGNRTRAEYLVRCLMLQNIEVHQTEQSFRLKEAEQFWSGTPASVTLPAGTFIVPLDQPMGRLASTLLDFDPRMNNEALAYERKSLEKDHDSKIYDITSWSLPLAYGVSAYRSRESVPNAARVESILQRYGTVDNPSSTYGFLLDYADDASVTATVRLFEHGYVLRGATEEVTTAGIVFSRGTILIRLHDNPSWKLDDLRAIAKETGVRFVGVNTALTTSGPDLGGNDFVLLKAPHIALVSGPEVGTGSFGALWHLLDERLKMRFSIVQVSQLGSIDLDRYTVVVLPSANSSETIGRVLGRATVGRLNEWMSRGGTVIAVGNSAAYAADTSTGLSSTRLLHQVLKEREMYDRAVAFETAASNPVIDSVALWENKKPVPSIAKTEKPVPLSDKEIAMLDKRAQLFMPRGAILRAELAVEHWMNFGVGTRIGAHLFTSNAFVSREPVQTPARFADAAHLRLSGLLWPEARERWASTAYATRESKGRGQIVLFADDPLFRAFFHGTGRMLMNALVLGPGFGTSSPTVW